MECSHVGCEPYNSAQPEIFVFSQTLVIVQATLFVLSGFQYLSVCQDLSVSKRGDSQLASRFRLVGSWTLIQQLLKYVHKLFVF